MKTTLNFKIIPLPLLFTYYFKIKFLATTNVLELTTKNEEKLKIISRNYFVLTMADNDSKADNSSPCHTILEKINAHNDNVTKVPIYLFLFNSCTKYLSIIR